jgi:hypothetical protein
MKLFWNGRYAFIVRVLVIAFVLSMGISRNAHAVCYKLIGCTDADYFKEKDLSFLSCKALAYIRNSIFSENKYCFKTQSYRQLWGNIGCRYTVPDRVPLTMIEHSNVLTIRLVEEKKSCIN